MNAISRNKKILIAALAGAALVVAVAAIIIPAIRKPGAQPPASSSTQKGVDLGLSLAPPPSSPTSTPSSSSNGGITASRLPAKPPAQQGCALSLSFGITAGSASATGASHYLLAAKNIGNTPCQSASISVYYADNETYESSAPQATADGYYWKLGDLAAGQESDIALVTDRTAPLAAGAAPDEACLSANNGTDACSNAGSASQIASPPASANVNANPPAAGTGAAAPRVTLASFPDPPGKEIGVWEWTPASQMSAAAMQQAVAAAAANHFTAIYLTIDDYLPIAAMGSGAAQSQALQHYESQLDAFLSLAAQHGMSVDAEAEQKDWAEAGSDSGNAAAILSFVAQYNQSRPAGSARFRGVQFDIEPYLLPQYENDQSGVLTRYVQLVDALVQQDKSLGVPLAIIVPHFYGSADQWTPKITVDGIQDYAYDHIVRLLNELPSGDGRIIEMSYRNTADGAGGAIALSSEEVESADASNVKVIIAQETGPVTPAYVTFYGMSRDDLFGQIGAIDDAFASDTAFAGVAVDYLDPYLQLR